MMKTTLFLLLLISALLLLAAPGCSEQQLSSVDHVVADANMVGQGIVAIARGPAAPLIPFPIDAVLGLIGIGVASGAALWQKIRAAHVLEKNIDLTTRLERVNTTLGAVVDGVEAAGEKAKAVKASIKQTMQQREIYRLANPIVDGAKQKNF